MFLQSTIMHNKKLIEAALDFHQQGIIPPNTYVIDLDTVKRNAKALSEKAKKQDIELFFMTKQFGRNPLVAQAIVESGIEKAVAVDPWEAMTLSKNGIQIGHVGHLVQIPVHMISTILNLNPDYVTVFSYENARNISRIAQQMGKKQKVFLRIANKDDYIYNGQEGGFTFEQLVKDIESMEKLEGIEIAGLTSFPCILIQDDVPTITPNVKSMQTAKLFLMNRGYEKLEMNMPSATSTATMKLLKENGATQGEPGHALIGTTPLHASQNLEEKPAMVYVSEVSHLYNNHAYVFGGGFYPRSHMKEALVGTNRQNLKRVPTIDNAPTNIDYYGSLATDGVRVGDTVIYAFRTQVFVTNAHVAVLKNISANPELVGIYDSMGNLIN
ncbi:YhfX family PLP-dependent enzyme [Bacillaceae bacterium ZC4]|jgi:Predicted amino acid racemase|uniref:YhfX family PLP-dependent enzyme n=1 Tax=Aeribacillus TaxID=1055323 RepID=UPI0007B4872C|nr:MULTISPECIES: YhfX family PLP-dependent enzyme [Aeribacillus]AXI38309.1 YhfX family PLP-dependent enzyme [Bacillaceae bacterium ZC4]KZM54586.1 amino-acid racemase [Aeribacillus pallidus]MED0651378.1 YhfX family PLP-dependent enzyme [Aeribacillus composti]MED0703767.1 YhfX family PLP-dependent enzyme [Aeribacillus composti]MED4487292.1 YhfX family PLP-dependent enzyme [Aeribacillus pallidus]